MNELVDIFVRGGVIMYPIALGSVIALAIFLERLFAFQGSRIAPEGLAEAVRRALADNRPADARDACLRSDTPLARILLVAVEAAGAKRDALRSLIEDAGKREVARLSRFVEALGTIAAIEPLLGLLGTVFGMIQVFQRVVDTSREGAVDPGQLAAGIWQALITTAAGLVVAIPAYVGYRWLLARAERHTLAMEDAASATVELVAEDGVRRRTE